MIQHEAEKETGVLLARQGRGVLDLKVGESVKRSLLVGEKHPSHWDPERGEVHSAASDTQLACLVCHLQPHLFLGWFLLLFSADC